jgi:xylulokinase
VVIDETGALLALAGSTLTVSRPHPRWSEQSPETGGRPPAPPWTSCATARRGGFGRIRAIGLSGQMHGAVLMDAQDAVLRPAILWSDSRSAPECAELERRAPRLHGIAGNLAMPGFTAPKLLWVARHEPQLFARIATVLLPKDWLRFMMTGRKCAIRRTRPVRCGWMWKAATGPTNCWPPPACGAIRCRRWSMAVRSPAPCCPRWRRPGGWRADVIVAGGAGDGAASAVGIGAVKPGMASSRWALPVCCSWSMTASARIRARHSRLLPYPAAALAPDERDALGGQLPALVLPLVFSR